MGTEPICSPEGYIIALTVREIDIAKPAVKPYKLADSGGLCLLVTPTGGKLWRYRYRFNGTEKMMALGEYPFITLTEVRDLHFAARKTLASGIDPMAERKAVVVAKQEAVVASQREAGDSFEKVPINGGRNGLKASLRATRIRSCAG